MSLLLLLGSSGLVDKSDSDTGSGADSASLAAALSAADTGSGADAASLAAVVSAVEAGSGADAAEIAAQVSGDDTGAGADDASVESDTADAAGSEAGSGTEGALLTAALSDSDTASGADAASASAGLSPVEAGAGSETASVSKTETGPASDTGAGGDYGRVATFGDAQPSPGSSLPPPDSPSRHIKLLYDGIDIWADVITESARFLTAANGVPGVCTVRVKDPEHKYSFVTGRDLILKIDGDRHWTGYVARVRYGYFLIDAHDPGTRVRYLEIQGVDLNALFPKRVLYDKGVPTRVQLTTYAAGTNDNTVILQYLADHLDLSGDAIGATLVEHVGTPSTDSNISGAAGWTWGQFMDYIRRNVGAIFYLDPDRNLVYTDVDTPTSGLTISDRPAVGEVGCRELEIDFNGDKLTNEAFVWGAGQGAKQVVLGHVSDQPSIDAHGLWQTGQFEQSVWRQATVDRMANSIVHGSPQNKRGGKDDAVSARCTVFDTRFRVANKVTLRSEVFAYEDVLPVRAIELTFPSGSPKFVLTLSHETDPPWSTFEFWMPNFDLPDLGLDLDIPDISISLPPFDPCFSVGGECSFDDFENRTIGKTTAASAWGDASSGGSWDAHFALNGGVGGGGVQSGYGYLRLEPWSGDNDAWANIAASAELNGGSFNLLARIVAHSTVSGTTASDRIRIGIGSTSPFPTGDALIELFFNKTTPSNGYVLLADNGSPQNTRELLYEDEYLVRWERDVGAGTSRVRVWLASQPEPTTWDVTDTTWAAASDQLSIYAKQGPNDGAAGEYFEARILDIGLDCSMTTVGELMGLFDAPCEGLDETFSRVLTGSWGTADWGPTYQASGALLNVDGDSATIARGTSGRVRNWLHDDTALTYPIDFTILQYASAGGPSIGYWLSDQEITGATSPPLNGPYQGVAWRWNPIAASLLLTWHRKTSAGGGVGATVAVPGVDGTAPFWIRLYCEANILRVKAWQATDPEPATWTFDLAPVDVGVPRPTYLWFDLFSGNDSSVTIDEYHFNVDCPPPVDPCADAALGELADPPSGPTSEEPEHTATYVYTLQTAFVPNTERVWVEGHLLRRGADYTPDPTAGTITISATVLDPLTGAGITPEVYVTYTAAPELLI